jgi:hypothetical protein
MTRNRAKCAWLIAVPGVGVAFTGLVASAASAAGAGPSNAPGQVVKAAIASGTEKGSVRVTVHFFSGKTTGELVQDSARQMAKQTVAIGKERISIVLRNGTAYFAGNSQGLTKYFGLPKAVAAQLSGRWISISPTDSGFQSVTAGLTLSAALKEVTPTGTVTRGKKKTVNRQPTLSVLGTGSAGGPQTTLFVAAHGTPLPVEAVSSTGSGSTASGEIVTFSRWGEKVTTPTPSNSIPVSTLSLGTSSGG